MVKAAHYILAALAALLCDYAGQAADIAILNGDVSLNITTATAGQQPVSDMDETGQLEWTTLETDAIKKITAHTSLGAPNFELKLTAINISSGDGTSAGEITLSTTPSNLVEDIRAGILITPGSCTLSYRASATAAGGSGTDDHRVTFTIMDQ